MSRTLPSSPIGRQNFNRNIFLVVVGHALLVVAIVWIYRNREAPGITQLAGGGSIEDVRWTSSIPDEIIAEATLADQVPEDVAMNAPENDPESEIVLPGTRQESTPQPPESTEAPQLRPAPAPTPVPEPEPLLTRIESTPPQLQPAPAPEPEPILEPPAPMLRPAPAPVSEPEPTPAPEPEPPARPVVALRPVPAPRLTPQELEPAPAPPAPTPAPAPPQLRPMPTPAPVPAPAEPALRPLPSAPGPVAARPIAPSNGGGGIGNGSAGSNSSGSGGSSGNGHANGTFSMIPRPITPQQAPAEVNLSAYDALIKQVFTARWVPPQELNGSSLTTKTTITVSRDGRILDARISQPSGHAGMDQSVAQALRSVSQMQPLPAAYSGDSLTRTLSFQPDL